MCRITRTRNCRWLIVTNDTEWEPYDETFNEKEQTMTDYDEYKTRSVMTVNSHSTAGETDIHLKVYHGCAAIAAISSTERHLTTTDKMIATAFHCSPAIASKTRKVMTQRGIRSMTDNLCRRFRTKHDALRYNQLGGRHGRFYSDTLFASVKSLFGNNVGQIFANDIGFTYLTPLKSKSEAPNAPREFIQDVGIPSHLHTDEAKELTIGRWKEICNSHGIRQTQTEPHSPFQNRAEINIREVKKLT